MSRMLFVCGLATILPALTLLSQEKSGAVKDRQPVQKQARQVYGAPVTKPEFDDPIWDWTADIVCFPAGTVTSVSGSGSSCMEAQANSEAWSVVMTCLMNGGFPTMANESCTQRTFVDHVATVTKPEKRRYRIKFEVGNKERETVVIADNLAKATEMVKLRYKGRVSKITSKKRLKPTYLYSNYVRTKTDSNIEDKEFVGIGDTIDEAMEYAQDAADDYQKDKPGSKILPGAPRRVDRDVALTEEEVEVAAKDDDGKDVAITVFAQGTDKKSAERRARVRAWRILANEELSSDKEVLPE